MTILMLIPDFGRGGAERVFSQLSAELAKQHRVIDCVFNLLEKREYESGNEIIDLNVPAGRNVFLKAFYFILRVYRLRQIKKKYNIHLSISHLEGADYINVLSRFHDRIVLCIHGTKIHDKNIKGVMGWLRLRVMMPFIYRRASHIVSVSEGIKNELVKQIGLSEKKITVINNFFDLQAIRLKAEEPLSSEYGSLMCDCDVIITSGRLTHEKNQRLLISLMPALLKRRPNVKLVILGSGKLQKELADEAEKKGLGVQTDAARFSIENQVFFQGFCKNPFPYFRKAKIFILPSLWEGFPLALCEALICGTPVIAHDCATGPREIVAPDLFADEKIKEVTYTKYGILIPFKSNATSEVRELWITAILKLLADERLKEGFILNSRTRVLAFSKEFVLQKWFHLINSSHL